MPSPEAPSQAVTDREYRQLVEFLYHEAQLLDHRKLNAWLKLLTDDISYRVVAPTVRALEEADNAPVAVFMDEDKSSLRTRVLQLTTPEYTIAENPPSITRRFVTNILAMRKNDASQIVHFTVDSHLLLYRSRGAHVAPYFFSAERHDIVRRVDEQLRLAQRQVRLDETVFGTRNMSVFF